ncbi:MAG: WHG domain-containing protein [Acetobacteraceae bacterium]|nr:WHG domain-containing protein [Acetobacteraceae bacterium]
MPRAGLNADAITRAAAAIVDADGAASLTLARLAADLRVAPPSLYKHIAGLEDLLVRVGAFAFGRLADDLTTAALGRSGRLALFGIAGAYRRFAIEHAGLYSLTQVAPERSSAEQQAQVARAVGVVEAIVRSYGVPNELALHAVRMVRAGLHGFADIEGRGGFQLLQSLDVSFDMLVDALDTSLKNLGLGRRHALAHLRALPNES